MDRLFRLPDDLIVYPGHTAGSACGKKIGEAPYTTIRGERIGDSRLQARSRDASSRWCSTACRSHRRTTRS